MKYIFITHFLFFSIFYISINCMTIKSNSLEKNNSHTKLINASRTLSQKLPPKTLYGTVSIITQDTVVKRLSAATVTIYSRNDSIISTLTDSMGNFSINITEQFKKLNNPFYLFVRHKDNYKNITKIYKNFKNPIKINLSKSNHSIISN